ncbi:unnamed protein product [Spirodela intermedia]|uniref:Uncharacterized protein n=1 Tax=Spirodela intermedia TaxID=51605 RepID=A0A7I8IP71_SPIIN|nr:unnamed protein product [Spirodela intermedia]CAA6658941.1 unnamed protein product [Spirodela intermedia]
MKTSASYCTAIPALASALFWEKAVPPR